MKTTKKEMSKLILFTILILLSLHPLLVSSPQFTYAITNCSNISNSVSLENNFLNNNGTCFTIDASNLFLNGSGFTVGGNGSGTFTMASSLNNVTIFNFNTLNFTHGINFSTITNSSILNNNFTSISFSAGGQEATILLKSSSINNNLSNNRINASSSDSQVYGIWVLSGSNNTITRNIINISSNNGNAAAIEINSMNNTVLSNQMNSSDRGVSFSSSNANGNNILSNEISTSYSTSQGIFVSSSKGNNLSYNNINMFRESNGAIGIYLSSANDNFLSFNNVSDNASGGPPAIRLDTSHNNTISYNIINSTGNGIGIGPGLGSSHNNTIVYNSLNISQADGIKINGSNVNVSHNFISIGSVGVGINIVAISNNNTYFNNTIFTFSSSDHGIQLGNVQNQTVSSNTINTTGTTAYGIYLLNTANNNNLISNIINVSGAKSDAILLQSSSFNNFTSNSIFILGFSSFGVNVFSSSENNTFLSNMINITPSADNSSAIFINGSNNNIFIYNSMNLSNETNAVILNGSNNNFTSNVISSLTLAGSVGFNLSAGSNNSFFNNSITRDPNGGTFGFFFEASENNTINKNNISLRTNADSYPVFFNRVSSSNRIIMNDFINARISTTGFGIIHINGSHNNISYNFITPTSTTEVLDLTAGSNNNTILNNTINCGCTGGLYLSSSSNNTISYNVINLTGNAVGQDATINLQSGSDNNFIFSNSINVTGARKSGILIVGSNNNISSNSLFVSGATTVAGINLTSTSNNNTFFNNTVLTISNNAPGFELRTTSNNTLILNVVNTTGNNAHGIYSLNSGENNSFFSNVMNISGVGSKGIFILNSRNTTISSNNITTSADNSTTIFVSLSNNTNISFNILNTSGNVNSSGIRLENVDGVEGRFNKIITNGTSVDTSGIYSISALNTINFTSDNITTVVNSTQVCGGNIFLNNISSTRTGSNTGLIGFDNSACTANVTVSWFVNLSVINGTNNAVSGAGINITNTTGQSLGFFTTDGNGQARFTLAEFLANATRTTYASPYNFTINYTGATTNITPINLSLTNSTFFTVNLSTAPGVNTSTDPGTSSGSSSGGSSGTSIAPRSTTTTITAPPATTTTTSTTATSESTATTVPAVSLFVGDKGDAVSNLALIVGDFMPADQAIVLNDLLLTLQQASVSRAPIAREEFQFALPKNSLELNETIGKIKNIITSNDLPGVLATDNIIGSLETKMDQFLTFNSTADYDSNKVVFDNNEENKPGAYFYAKTGQQLFQYTSKFQEGLRSRTTASNDVNASLIDIKDRKLKLMGDDYVVNQIFVDTNGSRNNMISIELVKGGTEGILFEGEKGELTNEEKEYSIEILVISAEPKYAIIKVNGELLPKLGDGGSIITSTGVPFVIRDIVLSEGNIRKSLVRFYVGGKRVLLEDTNMTDNNFNTGGLTVNNQLINEESVRINAFFTDSSNTNVVINTIDYSLLADGKNGNIYIPEGETLKQNLRQPEAIFSDNFDMKFNGLKKQSSNNITFIPEGNNKYSLEFTSQELLHYKIPILTTQRDGSMRYGEKTGDSDRNLVFSEGANNAQYVVQKDDYIILSNINQNGALNTNAAFGVFNLATMNDWFGFTRILKYDGYNPSDRTLRFTDQALDIAENVKEVTTDANNNATLQMGGAFFNIKVNTTDESIAVDIDGDGKINGNTSIISTQGGALIVLGTKNPKKPSQTATLGSINGTANISITTLGNKFDSGGGNFRTGFVFETRTGNNIGINKLSTLGISFTPSSDPKLSVALDGYGSYYTLHNDSTGLAETLIVDYPENQRVMDFRLEGTPATEDKNLITELKPLPENTTKLASEVDKLSGYNSVIVGSPCENHLSAKLLNYPEPCDSILPEDKALVKLFKYENGNLALLIAGKTGEQMKEAVSRIVKGEVLFNSTQAELIKEQREVEEASTQTEGTTTEETV